MPRETAKTILRIEAEAVSRLADRLDERFDRAVAAVLATRGRVIVSGMGKSGIVARKIAATFASTGTPAYFVHPADAVHGDLGMMVEGDLVVALSHSGETAEIVRLLEYVRRLGLRLVALVGRPESTLGRNADVALDVGVDREACPLDLAPSASTTAALAMGDALALTVAERKGFTAEEFARRHPGGSLGRRLTLVRGLMRTGERVPRVDAAAGLLAAVAEMSRKGMGMTTVCDGDGRLLGVITDGDLRRLLEKGGDVASTPALAAATRNPRTVAGDEAASQALALLEKHHITSLIVTDAAGRVEGVVHLHDLWRLELF